MIQKKDFIKIMTEVEEQDKRLTALGDVNFSLCMGYIEQYDLKDLLIKTLELALGLKSHTTFGSTLAWWVFETNYGKKNHTILLGKKTFYIDTIEKLWDYLSKYEIKK